MELRGLCAGYMALIVMATGAGTAVALPQGMVAVPGGVIATDPMAAIVPVTALSEDEALAMLKAEGFVVVEMHRTWLGRIVITAEGKAGRREIVLHPYDGQVLRDVIVESAELPAADPVAEDAGTGVDAPVEMQAAEAAPDAVVLPLNPPEQGP